MQFFIVKNTATHLSAITKKTQNSNREDRNTKIKNDTIRKWLTLIIVATAGGLMTKLPYLRETYMDPLQAATGATKTQLGLLMSAYGIVNFICYFPGGVLADRFSAKKLIAVSCFGTGLIGL